MSSPGELVDELRRRVQAALDAGRAVRVANGDTGGDDLSASLANLAETLDPDDPVVAAVARALLGVPDRAVHPSPPAGRAGVVAGVLTMLWTLVSFLGFGPGTATSVDVGLTFGALAVVLGGVGLVQCHRRGVARGRAAGGWAIGLGVVFGALPGALLLAILATGPRW